jgi:hypothetical protein
MQEYYIQSIVVATRPLIPWIRSGSRKGSRRARELRSFRIEENVRARLGCGPFVVTMRRTGKDYA